MAEYRIRETGEVVSDLRLAFPNVSIPPFIRTDDLEALGVDPVLSGPTPSTTRFQRLVRDGVIEDEGQWFTHFVVIDLPEMEIESLTADQWRIVRLDRDARLTATDWTQLPDSPVDPADWTAYRQALRDITEQPDPFEIEWPVIPGE